MPPFILPSADALLNPLLDGGVQREGARSYVGIEDERDRSIERYIETLINRVETLETDVETLETAVVALSAGSAFVGCALYRNAALGIPNAVNPFTGTPIPWDAEEFDPQGFHDNAVNPQYITIPTGYSGKYLIYATLIWQNNNTVGSRRLEIWKNFTRIKYAQEIQATITNGFWPHSLSALVSLNAGDIFEIHAFQDSGVTNNIAVGSDDCFMYLVRVGT